ncbi:hypothetical protein BKA63DRAFT_169464 [Paraphoma chrysanthemicola]|nr:hypothetical protein BKA63DRAFT_169464 [Paraphoma chrysanthemicola]
MAESRMLSPRCRHRVPAETRRVPSPALHLPQHASPPRASQRQIHTYRAPRHRRIVEFRRALSHRIELQTQLIALHKFNELSGPSALPTFPTPSRLLIRSCATSPGVSLLAMTIVIRALPEVAAWQARSHTDFRAMLYHPGFRQLRQRRLQTFCRAYRALLPEWRRAGPTPRAPAVIGFTSLYIAGRHSSLPFDSGIHLSDPHRDTRCCAGRPKQSRPTHHRYSRRPFFA